MRALVALALGLAVVLVTASALAMVYVPGQYKDGIYVRPHFLDFPEQTIGGPLLLPPDLEAAKAKAAQDSLTLEPKAGLQKRRPLPAS